MGNTNTLQSARLQLEQLRHYPMLSCLPTGFQVWDQLTGGLVRGGVTMIAGRPRMGKTALLLNIVSRISQQLEGNIALLSPENDEQVMAMRILRIGTKTNLNDLLRGTQSRTDVIAKFRQFFQAQKGNIHTRWMFDPTLEDIYDACYEIPDLQLLVVDDPENICEPINHFDVNVAMLPKRVPMEKILYKMKDLAIQLDIPILTTARLHRSLEKRPDKHPRIHDLKKIGVPLELVDQLVFLYRLGYYRDDCKDNITECNIVKTCFGQPGTIRLTCQPEFDCYHELSESET